MTADPAGAARLLSETDDLRAPPERIGDVLARSGWQPGLKLSGVLRIDDRLRQPPPSWSDLAFDGVQGD